jgi:hypothetical protein
VISLTKDVRSVAPAPSVIRDRPASVLSRVARSQLRSRGPAVIEVSGELIGEFGVAAALMSECEQIDD